MIYSKIRSMQGFWILGKISDHQAFPLDAEDIDKAVEQLTQYAHFRKKLDREKMEKVIGEVYRRFGVNDVVATPSDVVDVLIKYLTE